MNATITAFATWTPAGVAINSAPRDGATGKLAPWAEAKPLTAIHPRARKLAPNATPLVQLAYELLVTRPTLDKSNAAVVLGSATGCATADLDFLKSLQTKGIGFGSPAGFVYTLPTAFAGELSIAFDLRGEVQTVSAGLASGVTAIASAAQAVASGRYSAAICGSWEFATHAPSDAIALLLLERSDQAPSMPSLGQPRFGFGDLPKDLSEAAPAAGGFLSAQPVLQLCRRLSEKSPALLVSRDPAGFWAALNLDLNP